MRLFVSQMNSIGCFLRAGSVGGNICYSVKVERTEETKYFTSVTELKVKENTWLLIHSLGFISLNIILKSQVDWPLNLNFK